MSGSGNRMVRLFLFSLTVRPEPGHELVMDNSTTLRVELIVPVPVTGRNDLIEALRRAEVQLDQDKLALEDISLACVFDPHEWSKAGELGSRLHAAARAAEAAGDIRYGHFRAATVATEWRISVMASG